MSAAVTQKCPRPGCEGEIEDGYCTVCGQALSPSEARVAASATTSAGAVNGSSQIGSTRSAHSTRSSRSLRSARSGTTRTASSRRALGGLLIRPNVVQAAPETRLISGTVPESKRYCQCGQKLTLEKGFCSKCGQAYSFLPGLEPGALVLGKYEVKGTIAFGGLGWIYLAFDQLLRRYVVMKGLLNSHDPALVAVAAQEREFLATVDHPNIVKVFDFITWEGQGYIVMEHVHGSTLMQVRRERGAPLTPAEACSAIYGVLPAFAYLDEHDLVYNDFKPENVMLTGAGVKLIDLGAVRRVDDVESDLYATEGYSAPEADHMPSPLSDIYTVGRALAVLVAQFDFRGKYKHSLPSPAECPVFAQYESLYSFLVKATRNDPNQRFQTAEEMAEQLLGVMREIALEQTQLDLGPVESPLFAEDSFTSDRTGLSSRANYSAIPRIKVDPTDPAARIVTSATAVQNRAKRLELLERSVAQFPQSGELPLRIAEEKIGAGVFPEAEALLKRAHQHDPLDWRVDWLQGRIALAQGRAQDAQIAFGKVSADLPGELAPKLALGLAEEMVGDLNRAALHYDHVSRIDPMLTSAAFGLGRVLLKQKNRPGAVEAYHRVPLTSNRYPAAQIAIVRALLDTTIGAVSREDVFSAGDIVEQLQAQMGTSLEVQQLTADLCRFAVAELDAGRFAAAPRETLVAQTPFVPRALRHTAARALRACARFAPSYFERTAYIDQAHATRPWTWL